MAINKNFVIKNGLEVNTNVLVAASDEQQVGVGTTRPYYKLHVGGGEGNRGGIGATDLTISGIATLGVANSESSALRILGVSTFQGDIDLLGSAGVSTVLWDASENRLEFKDNASVGFGTGNDLTIYHDGSTSWIKDTVDDLRISSNKITLEIEDGTDVKVIDQYGVNITGVTTSNRLYISGISTFMDDVDFDSQVRFDESEKALTFVDGAAIRVGTGSDFSIFHDGSNTYLRDSGTGELFIEGSQVNIKNIAGEYMAYFTDDGESVLYYDNTKRIETVGHGATVFGDFITSGVGTFGKLYVTGISTFANTVNVSTGATITTAGNAAFAGIVTANGGVNVGTAVTIDAETGNVAISGITTIGGNLYVTGDITYDEVTGRNLNITGITTFGDDVLFDGTNDITWDKSENAFVFNDGAAIRVGTGSDFSIFHDGSNTYLRDSGTGQLFIEGSQVNIKNIAGEYMAFFTDDGTAALYYDNVRVFDTTPQGVNISGVTTTNRLIVSGVSTQTGGINVGTAATISANGNATFSGIVTASQFQGGGIGVGIGSTTAHVGYGFTYLDLKGPGVSTVYASATTGITTIYFQGGGGSSVGAAGTWQNDGTAGISTAKNVGINTVGVAVTALQGGQKGGSTGVGASAYGVYIGNGMVITDNELNGDHYIGTAFNGIMAGPVTVNGYVTIDGNWAVV